jgi:spore coat protein U-like protein
MKNVVLSLAVVSAILAGTGVANAAGSANSTLSVTASVAANCTIATTPVAFGTYDPLSGTDLTNTGSVGITCVKNAVPTITLDLGSNASGTTRRMKGASVTPDMLAYELYQPPSITPNTACGALTQVWGTTGAAIFSPGAAPSKNARTYNVCGKVTAGQDVQVDSYSDTVNAVVNF